jgi:hypothetical protein
VGLGSILPTYAPKGSDKYSEKGQEKKMVLTMASSRPGIASGAFQSGVCGPVGSCPALKQKITVKKNGIYG